MPPLRGPSLFDDDNEVAAEYSLSVPWLLPGRLNELPTELLSEKVIAQDILIWSSGEWLSRMLSSGACRFKDLPGVDSMSVLLSAELRLRELLPVSVALEYVDLLADDGFR